MPPRDALLPALAACLACLPPEPPPLAERAPALVRVATWNVHDLFDAEDRLVPPGDADLVPGPEEVEGKLARVAAVLARLDADLVLLQEVEGGAVLARLAALSGYPAARLVDGNDPRGIDVAALSRLPLRAYLSHAEELGPDGRRLWPRDCVEILAEAGGRPLALVGTHLSSALSDDGTRRRWQAARLRELADLARAAEPEALVLAGGDLNDAPGSAALEPLLADGAWRDATPAAPATWGDGADAARLDYLLVAAEDAAAVAGAEVQDGPDVEAASDHRPVVLDLRVGREVTRAAPRP
jgi:endonuclease/exonuclease/phosphatase family metal-dependent hydrolase